MSDANRPKEIGDADWHVIKTRMCSRLRELQDKGYDKLTSEEMDEWAWLRTYWPIIKPEQGR